MEAIGPANQSAKVNAEVHTGVFRAAVLAGPDQLSPRARARIIELSGPRPVRFWAELGLNWIVIAALIALGIWADHLVVTILCIIGIGTRQMVFGLLLHEQVHRLGARSRFADWWINVFAVYPLLVTTVEDYAAVHLSHHKYFFTDKDPDFVRKAGPDWTFPASIRSILRIIFRDLAGINTLALIRGKTAPRDVTEFRRRNPTPKLLRWFFFTAVAVALTVAGVWTEFLVFWVVPLLTAAQLFVRWIAVMEHKYNVPNATIHSVTPLIRLKWWQKILFPDFNFAQHVYHHMHPGVSFANLPAVHELYKAEGLVDETAIFNGQGAYLRYLVSGKRPSL